MIWQQDLKTTTSTTKDTFSRVKQLSIQYHTNNIYDGVVNDALFDLLILPGTDARQRLLSHRVQTSVASSVSYYRNTFGFEVVRVKPLTSFQRFELNLFASAEINITAPTNSALSPEAQHEILSARDFFIDNHLYLQPTPLTTLPATGNSWPALVKNEPVGSFLDRLNNEVHHMLQYQPNVTTVDTTAQQALDGGVGVCQDYTHIFLAIARMNRIPCRYVSGYINQGHNFLGDMQTHAWVEAYVPGSGWQGYDPTNNIRVDENFIKVAHGLDYTDCSPLRGVILSQGTSNSTTHTVKVTEIF
jgi:transglutaminase-like putative cysteine protease